MVLAENLHLKSEVGRSPFPSRYIIYINHNITHSGEICLVSKNRFKNGLLLFFVLKNRIYGHRNMIGTFPVAISIGDLVDGTAIQFAFIAAWASGSESGKYLEAILDLMDVDEMLLEDFMVK